MPFSLTPDRMFDCYAQITPTFLRQQGITLLLSDLDFTLAAKKTRRPDQPLQLMGQAFLAVGTKIGKIHFGRHILSPPDPGARFCRRAVF